MIPTLSQRRLNRALLARQHLLNRSRAPLTKVLESVGGIQMQYAPSGYIGLWTRCVLPRRSSVTLSLQRRHIVQATLLRGTIHLVSARDHGLLSAGIRVSRRQWWEKVGRSRGLTVEDVAAAAEVVGRELRDGPRRRAELVAAIEGAGLSRELWEGVAFWVDMVRVPPSGTWERRRADLYALADSWLGPVGVDEPSGLRHLIRRYLGGFGPASFDDIASWGQVPAPVLREVARDLELRMFLDSEGSELVDLPRAPLPPETAAAPVRFLPTWDATLLVHARRTGILREEHRPIIFSTKNPPSVGTFLIDGTVAGTWRLVDGEVRYEPFERLPTGVEDAVRAEAAELTAFCQ